MSNTTNIYIQRPALPATGYTALPNWLFECKTHNLKPRDLAVLNYLLTKCKNWKVRVSDVANWCQISKNTVYAALKVLQARGFARWERLSSGHVRWFIAVPDQPPAVTPHTKKPQSEKPQPNFDGVLTKNNKKPSIEETTTAPPENPPICKNQSICEPIIEPVVVVTEKPVLTPEPTTATELSNITPDLTVLDVFDAKENIICENPSIVEPVVVTEKPVLTPEPTTATELSNITPDLTVLDVFDAKENIICENPPIVEPVVVTEKPVLTPEPTTATELPNITPDLTVLDVFDAKEKNIVSNELKKVTDLTAQAVILFTLKTTIANNKVKDSPIALVLRLINLAVNDLLVTKYVVAKMKAGQTTSTPPVDDYKTQRIMKIRNLAAKHPECIEEMKKRGKFIFPSDTRYMYLPNDFREAGLI